MDSVQHHILVVDDHKEILSEGGLRVTFKHAAPPGSKARPKES